MSGIENVLNSSSTGTNWRGSSLEQKGAQSPAVPEALPENNLPIYSAYFQIEPMEIGENHFCDPDGDGEITDMIKDLYLQKAIRDNLGIGKEEPITVEHAVFLAELDADNYDNEYNIQDLTGLECFSNLTALILSRNFISPSFLTLIGQMSKLEFLNLYWGLDVAKDIDIAPLGKLENLVALNLAHNFNINDLSPLKGLTQLEELYLNVTNSYREIDVAPLGDLHKLRKLNISFNPKIVNYSSLSGLTNLEFLYLDRLGLGNIDFMREMHLLKNISLYHNNLTSISVASGFPLLETIYVDANQLTDISPLGGLLNLNKIVARGNEIADITALVQNPGLGEPDYIDLIGNCRVPEEQIEALRAKGAYVEWDPCCHKEWSIDLGGEKNDRGMDVFEGEDHNFVLIGMTESTGAGKKDSLVVKIDTDGNLVWQKAFGGKRDDVSNAFFPVPADSMSLCGGKIEEPEGFILAGYTNSFGKGLEKDGWLLKIDMAGNEIWRKRIGEEGKNEEYFSIHNDVHNASLILGGYSEDLKTGRKEALLTEIDALGNVFWNKTFGEGVFKMVRRINTYSSNEIHAVGYTEDSTNGGRDGLFVVTDSEGEEITRKNFGYAEDDEFNAVYPALHQEYSSKVLLAGYSNMLQDEKIGGWLLALVPWSNNYEIESEHFYGFAGAALNGLYDVRQTDYGGYNYKEYENVIFSGVSSGADGSKGPFGWVVEVYKSEYSEGYEWLWEKELGPVLDKHPVFLKRTYEGGHLAVGARPAPKGDEDAFLIKFCKGK